MDLFTSDLLPLMQQSVFADFLVKLNSTVTAGPDGTTLYRPKSGRGPGNFLFKKLNDTEFELLTDKFLATPERDFKTAELKAKWDSLPESSIRIAAELTTNAGLMQEIVTGARI